MRVLHELTDPEALVLAQIERAQPVTAYELRMIFARSPVSALSTSTGTVYPIIRRLKARGLIAGSSVPGDRRNTARLSITDTGRYASRRWLRSTRDDYLLPEDPIRTRLLYLDRLPRAEQLEWLRSMRAGLAAKLEETARYAAARPGLFENFAHENVRLSLTARLQWIDDVLEALESVDAQKTAHSGKA